jgi:hypothetical protein
LEHFTANHFTSNHFTAIPFHRQPFHCQVISPPRVISHLLGSSGYPVEPWLFPPVASDDLEYAQFNADHKSARFVVEQTIGYLKTIFRCLLGHRTLHYHPINAANIIYASMVLYNKIWKQGLLTQVVDLAVIMEVERRFPPEEVVNTWSEEGNNLRLNYIRQNYNN